MAARVIASDETTARIDGATHWHWVFVAAKAVLHQIAPRRAKAVAEEVLGEHRPAVWVSDRYAGQQDLAPTHQVCLAHVLRDVQYAIDCGDAVFAPQAARPAALGDPHRPARDRRCGRRRCGTITPAPSAASMRSSPRPRHTQPAATLQIAVKAWRTKFFVFLEDPDVPATNNACEREIRPSVVFRKVTGGFRSDWGAQIHAGYRSVTGTAQAPRPNRPAVHRPAPRPVSFTPSPAT